jgi:hypothetical protein
MQRDRQQHAPLAANEQIGGKRRIFQMCSTLLHESDQSNVHCNALGGKRIENVQVRCVGVFFEEILQISGIITPWRTFTLIVRGFFLKPCPPEL